MNLVLLVGNADPNLVAVYGMTGAPAAWPLETLPYDGVSEVPDGWQLMSDDDLRIAISNALPDHETWQASLIDPVVQVSSTIERAMTFGRQVIADFGAENVIRGMTTVQIATVAQELAPIAMLLQTGSLYTALAAMQSLVPDGTLLTGTLKEKYVNKIQAYLGLPLT